MISGTLDALGNALRHAAARRAYVEVQQLAVRAGETAAQEAHALLPEDPDIAEIATWLSELYARTDILLRIGRAAQADELRRVLMLKRYTARPYGQDRRVRAEI
jgi:hypothetical protein